jgi:peroxiredoxin
MAISVGDHIPSLTLVKATAEGPQPLETDSFFAGRKVALFSVPGAFTPTCSARHLPSFVEKAGELKAAWQQANDAQAVTMIADGNGDFAEALGLSADFNKFGMGKRGQRWSALVEDGVVRQLNVEEPGGYGVSGAEHMLGQL